MDLLQVTLNLAALSFCPDRANPKTHKVGENGCKRIVRDAAGITVIGDGRRFWVPFANVVWAEPAPVVEQPIPPLRAVEAPVPSAVTSSGLAAMLDQHKKRRR